ncbi:hypothetical protein [Sphingomonas sp. DT-204]
MGWWKRLLLALAGLALIATGLGWPLICRGTHTLSPQTEPDDR